MIRVLIAFLALFSLVYFTSAPSAEDIKRCVETTNYTAKRCEFEITR